MKDFDFDELDRAVSSVLTSKSKKDDSADNAETNTAKDEPATPVTDQSEVKVETSDQPAEEKSHVDSQSSTDSNSEETEPEKESKPSPSITAFEPAVPLDSIPSSSKYEDKPAESSDKPSTTDDSAKSEANEDNKIGVNITTNSNNANTDKPDSDKPHRPQPSLAEPAVTARRGRFMDMVPTGATTAGSDKPTSRTGITIKPLSDGPAKPEESDSSLADEVAKLDNTTEPAKPDLPPLDINSLVDTDKDDSKTDSSDEADNKSETEIVNDLDTKTSESDTADKLDSAFETEADEKSTTPFIADVPVEKRPLNKLPLDEDADSTDADKPDEAEQAVDNGKTVKINDEMVEIDDEQKPAEVNLASIPKEFNKEIMAIEANESVGQVADKSAEDTEESDAGEGLPVFSTGDSAQVASSAKGTSSKLIWVVIFFSLLLVGGALGALYFLYLQA